MRKCYTSAARGTVNPPRPFTSDSGPYRKITCYVCIWSWRHQVIYFRQVACPHSDQLISRHSYSTERDKLRDIYYTGGMLADGLILWKGIQVLFSISNSNVRIHFFYVPHCLWCWNMRGQVLLFRIVWGQVGSSGKRACFSSTETGCLCKAFVLLSCFPNPGPQGTCVRDSASTGTSIWKQAPRWFYTQVWRATGGTCI